MNRILLELQALALVIFVCFVPTHASALTVDVTPGKIPITIGYHGTKLTVKGSGLNTEDVIVQIHSQLGEEHLKYKGKAGGIFWMKLGNIVFKDVPKVYLVYSTRDIHDMLPPKTCKELAIGYDALKSRAKIKTDMKDFERDTWIVEFLKFMEEEHLYHEEDGIVKVDRENHTFSVDIDWPFEAPPGEYFVEVFAVKDGQVVDKAEARIRVERVGLIRQLSHMAFERPALYGIIAIIVAIVAGFGVGMVFLGGGGH